MHLLPTDWAGDHLHWSRGIITPVTGANPGETAVSSGEQCGMPAEESRRAQRLIEVAGRIQHHVDHAIHVAVGGR
jgi:hypothetical protein